MHQNFILQYVKKKEAMGDILLSVSDVELVEEEEEDSCKCILLSAAAAERRGWSSESNCRILFLSAEIIPFCFFPMLLAKGVSL